MPVTIDTEASHGRRRPTISTFAAARFPLVPRPQALCGTINDRVQRVRTHVAASRMDTSGALAKACEALNLAALIYSDCGMPDAARDLCLRQFTAFIGAGPFDADTTKLALQPLINIGRLHTRAGDGVTAYEIHQQMFNAAASGTTIQIANQTIDIGALVRPGIDQRKTAQWLWTVLLSDGLRALCRSGHWADALTQAEKNNGIGNRLLDGRQIAIIAAATDGDLTHARNLIDSTACSSLWEIAVLSCLWNLTTSGSMLAEAANHDAMYASYLTLSPESVSSLFLVRVGLTVVDLAEPHPVPVPAIKTIKRNASFGDGYAAAELLNHPIHQLLDPAIIAELQALVAAASLGAAPTGKLADDLASSAEDSLLAVARCVAR